MKILLVEDDLKTASFIIKGFQQEGFTIDHATDGEKGLFLATTQDYDAAIIDVMLPKLDGLNLIDKLRNQKINLPILILSAKGSVEDRIKGLKIGADDYLVKPFAFSELLARIYALIRRAKSTDNLTTLEEGDLIMDLLRKKVFREGKQIDLQPKEFALLEYLLRNKGRVVSKTMIMEHVWDYNFDPQTNVVEARICRLRDKIDRPFKKRLIHTIKGLGYVLEYKD